MTTQPMTLDDILADLRRFPETMHLPLLHNGLGSPYVVIETDSDTVTTLAREKAVNTFRRVLLDPVRGLVMLMTPTSQHELLTKATDRLVSKMTERLGIPCELLGATRWGNAVKGSVEADDCYYIGDKAVGYVAARKEGYSAISEFTASNKPDLVVEVTVSHYDAVKVENYRKLNVPEYCQLKARKDKWGHLTDSDIEFLNLQAASGPTSIRVSEKLPGMTPAMLADCMNRMNATGMHEWDDVIDQTLLEYGIVPIDSDDNDGGGTPSGFAPA